MSSNKKLDRVRRPPKKKKLIAEATLFVTPGQVNFKFCVHSMANLCF